ncbi:S8 family peptidase [Aquibacillus sp. 3ASR75-11]|uniref:S8 family peptidase n=1 Tax=Terrihalobacillus insolitus TaxID=2950438 RepID=A0A9X3WT36_9BACI|nr:S8 family peptidase [Terrihalobacillus insolitus]MDC3411968.1 S8 family peptidase [Terrihalobacillus insolitus]MDC3423346.1 S8 family peptidase [Terrihalobacillus insolitus]
MKHILSFLFFFLLVFTQNHLVQAEQMDYTRVVVTFNNEVNESVIENQGGYIEEQFRFLPAVIAMIPSIKVTGIEKAPSVLQVQKDSTASVTGQLTDWGINSINTPILWNEGYTGKGVKVAIIDTGISNDHPDLNISGGKSFVSYTSSYDDDNGHGTHIAGTIAALDNNYGYVGVAPDAQIYALKAMDSNGKGSTIDLALAIDWAIQNNMDIINLSFEFRESVDYIEELINEAYEKGILVVAAAGNNGQQDGTIAYPAKYPSVIAVGAVNSNYKLPTFSKTGATLEIVAPGVNINSTYVNNGFAEMSGTSMATAYGSGYLALLKEAYPTLQATNIRNIMQEKALDLGVPGKDPLYGYGFIQSFSLVDRPFNVEDRFFRVVEQAVPVYDNRTGELVKVGTLKKGQVYSRVSDYGNWHRIQFGKYYGYVYKGSTQPVNQHNLSNLNNSQFKQSNQLFTPLKDVEVYDNTSGSLVPFATIAKGKTYPIVSDYGNWWRVDASGRIGYVQKSQVQQQFTENTSYFKVNVNRLPVYDNRSGSLVQVGSLEKGQVYPRVSDYGNWHRIQFGKYYGYVLKSSTSPVSKPNLKSLNTGYKQTSKLFTTAQDVTVYDNTSGSLVPFATISKGKTYPIVSDYGNWWRVDASGRIGYVQKSQVRQQFTENTSYFKVNVNNLPVYDNRSGSLVQVGSLEKGQIYPRVSDYGNWHRIQFGKYYGYVLKSSTSPVSQPNLKSLNTGYKQTSKLFTAAQDVAVYDNTSGSLVPFATIANGKTYPIVSDYGNWWRVDASGRIGYVQKDNVTIHKLN